MLTYTTSSVSCKNCENETWKHDYVIIITKGDVRLTKWDDVHPLRQKHIGTWIYFLVPNEPNIFNEQFLATL